MIGSHEDHEKSIMRNWLNSDGNFLFGKHEGDNIDYVASDDPSYLEWIVEVVEDISQEDLDVIKTSLKFGNFSRRK